MSVVLSDAPTGAELVEALHRGAAVARVPVGQFARPLSPHIQKWLQQVESAGRPKAATVERVRCLLAGEPVPIAALNNFQASPRAPSARRLIDPRADRDPPFPDQARVDRDPCWRCGVRGDLGCACRVR